MRARARAKRDGATADSVVATVPVAQRRPLGEILLEHGLVSIDQLNQALESQPASNARLGTLLIQSGNVDERSIAWALATQLGIPFVDLREVKPTDDALAVIPEGLAKRLGVIPFELHNGTVNVACADPLNAALLPELRRATSAPVRLAVAPESEIQRAIQSSYRVLIDLTRVVESFQSVDSRRVQVGTIETDAASDLAPVVQVVNMILKQALRDRASDIHIEPQGERVRVRFRIDGTLHNAVTLPSSMGPAVVSRIKIMGSMNIVERQRPQDGQISTTIDDRAIDIRVSTSPTIFGEKAVLRLLDKTRTLYRIDDLGMPVDTFEQFKTLVHSPFGMIICAGPTGSGKTTTLYASLAEVDTLHRNVMTIEDPVEYIFPEVSQIQIKEQAGVTFAGGLKSILRQDPDIILVGEMRDVETARIAIQSALTGHLVLSSVHATDAAAALHRFLDMGIESFLVASSVMAVVGQRLVRRICTSCVESYQPTEEELSFYYDSGGTNKDAFWRGAGCNFCAQSGYRDRVGVYELLYVSDEIKSIIVRNGSQAELREVALSQGMRPLRRAALDLIGGDITTIAEVLRAIYVL